MNCKRLAGALNVAKRPFYRNNCSFQCPLKHVKLPSRQQHTNSCLTQFKYLWTVHTVGAAWRLGVGGRHNAFICYFHIAGLSARLYARYDSHTRNETNELCAHNPFTILLLDYRVRLLGFCVGWRNSTFFCGCCEFVFGRKVRCLNVRVAKRYSRICFRVDVGARDDNSPKLFRVNTQITLDKGLVTQNAYYIIEHWRTWKSITNAVCIFGAKLGD